MPENNDATKQDLQELRTDAEERFRHMDERFDQVMEAIRDTQTELLRAFARAPQ